MSDLVFSLNSTMPVFLTMLLGFLFHRLGWISDSFAAQMNKFVFLIPLPVMLFRQLAETNFRDTWDGRFVLFCFAVTLLSIFLAFLLSHFIKSVPERGEFIQGAYRSSAAILGVAYIENIYGDATLAPLMILGAVPLYNVMAVVVLALTSEENRRLDRKTIRKTIKGIVTNPIILGIVFGLIWSVVRIPMPGILDKTLQYVAQTATPMGLLALGASIDPGKIGGKIKPAIFAAVLKLIGLEAIFLPVAASMGFRKEKLVAILIMLGSPTTVTSFVMAKNMGHEGTISSNTVMLTTICSAFTLTFWVWLVRRYGLI